MAPFLEGAAKAFNPDTVQMNYGMGWVIQDYRGQGLISHGGVIDGFKAHITLVPAHKIGIVILANLQDTRMNLALSNTLVDLLLNLPPKNWSEILQTELRKEAEAANERLKNMRELSHLTIEVHRCAGLHE